MSSITSAQGSPRYHPGMLAGITSSFPGSIHILYSHPQASHTAAWPHCSSHLRGCPTAGLPLVSASIPQKEAHKILT